MTTSTYIGLTFQGIETVYQQDKFVESKEEERTLTGWWWGRGGEGRGQRAVLGGGASEDLTGKKTFGKRPQRYLGKSVPGKGSSRVRPEVECAGHTGGTKGQSGREG